MARSMSILVAFMLATVLVQANQQSSGGECPSDDEPPNSLSLFQMNLQISKHGGEDTSGGTGGGLGKMGGGGGATGTHIASASQAAGGRIKLIVNSDVRYDAALNTLFESMEKASFDRWSDVIVMRGSASKDSNPFTPDTKYGKRNVTYIDMKLSSFDLHGFSGLYHHRHDSRVEADVYFYIHDTVLVNSTFPSKFDSMASTGKFEARHPPAPFNNICAIGSGVVDNYGTHFDTPKTKAEGLLVEYNGGVVSFAEKQTLLEETQRQGWDQQVDLWHTGSVRRPVFFPSFGLTKYVLWNKQGDLTGHAQAIGHDVWSPGDPECKKKCPANKIRLGTPWKNGCALMECPDTDCKWVCPVK